MVWRTGRARQPSSMAAQMRSGLCSPPARERCGARCASALCAATLTVSPPVLATRCIMPAKRAGVRPGDAAEAEEAAAKASRQAACLRRAAAILLPGDHLHEREAAAQ